VHVTVVGAGPFTAGLLQALAAERGRGRPTGRLQLRVVGRDTDVLDALRVRAQALRLGPAQAVPEPGGLDGSDVVVVQLRPGGTAGRLADELLAAELGVPGDESLGLGGLATALRGAPVLRALGAAVREHCPDARVLVLTNPLSTFVAELCREGVDAFGCCELPTATAAEVSDVCDLGRRVPSWSYTGLSHRGFLHDIAMPDGTDVLPLLVTRLRAGGRLTGDLSVEDIERLGAVPMKYHHLLSPSRAGWASPSEVPPVRATVVGSVRSALRAELLADPAAQRLATLTERATPWYDLMVVPVLLALAGGTEVTRVLDVMDDDGVVREHRRTVDRVGLHAADDVDAGALGDEAARLVSSYESGERAWSELLAAPSLAALTTAVGEDPAIPAQAHSLVVAALEPVLEQLRDQPVAESWTAR
jgi:6-phospho-beta-glucosidase